MTNSTRNTATLATSYTETTHILMPNHTNNLGRALGGSVLHWMDITGAIAARRFAREQVVTASMDHVDFRGAIDLGDVVAVTAYVFDTGDTSIDVLVTVHAERPAEGHRQEAAASFFTFVALDDDETPTAVPDLVCDDADERTLRDDALEHRRSLRQTLTPDA